MTLPTPVEISDATMAFPANALEFMPKFSDIPEDFQEETVASVKWYELQKTWMFQGLSERFSFQPAVVNGERINASSAFRQLSAIQRSFAPKHEHKMAAVAWLASIWMESVIFGPPGCPMDEMTVLGGASLDDWVEYFKEVEEAK